jgi:hypothetical protein
MGPGCSSQKRDSQLSGAWRFPNRLGQYLNLLELCTRSISPGVP